MFVLVANKVSKKQQQNAKKKKIMHSLPELAAF
jgi:hypothetical protein